MDLGLKGKKVIVAGGSRGIGRATVEIFAQEGADVAFFSRNAEQVADTVASAGKHGGKIIGEAFDMESGADAYKAWLKSAADKLGGCDIFVPMVSSSGAGATGDWQKSFDFDVMGAVNGVEVLEPYLEASGAGSIVFMSSTAAFETFLVPQAFNSTKATLLTYSKQLGQALGPKNIRVNVVSPGPIAFPGGNWEAIKGAVPELYAATEATFSGRWGGPDEVARTVVFLASPASSYTTGANVLIDGGYTKGVRF